MLDIFCPFVISPTISLFFLRLTYNEGDTNVKQYNAGVVLVCTGITGSFPTDGVGFTATFSVAVEAALVYAFRPHEVNKNLECHPACSSQRNEPFESCNE